MRKRKIAASKTEILNSDEPENKKSKSTSLTKLTDLDDPTKKKIFTNTTMPLIYDFEKLKINEIKIISLNIVSLNSSLGKGLKSYLVAEDASIVLLQETKLNSNPTEDILDKKIYPFQYYNNCKIKKGYSGTYLASKVEPIKVIFGINNKEFDEEGRCITAEYKSFFAVNSYIPNAGGKLDRLQFKQRYNKAIEAYVKELEKKKPVVWGGDFNVAHTEKDLSRPKGNHKTAGFTPEERSDFQTFLDNGFIDTWRHFNADVDYLFTYYSFRFQCRSKGLGWRLDYFLISNSLLKQLSQSLIRSEVYGCSDHCPLVLILSDIEM